MIEQGCDEAGLLIVNADDWGRDRETTDRTLDCLERGAVNSVSAMVFMQDSARAAEIAREQGIDAGLHLNFTASFSALRSSMALKKHQSRLSQYLQSRRLAQIVFHPGLIASFEYVVATQLDEFYRLYGAAPKRIDGHHHMHLCSNVVFAGLLPPGTLVRRNFSFARREKGFCNRLYRKSVDRLLARNYRLTDYFFSLAPVDPPERLDKIFALARKFTVEVETHPVNPDEYRFLMKDEICHRTSDHQTSYQPR